MAERTMSDALARTQTATPGAGVQRHDHLASKKRVIESPEVNAFIRDGSIATDLEQGSLAHSMPRATQQDVQLNAKIPAELYQRARRAVFENQMSKLEPQTLQDLVCQALSVELRRLGY